jgi:hypothetical protein
MASSWSSEAKTTTVGHRAATVPEEVVADVHRALITSAFSNGKLLHPRRLGGIAREEVEAFLRHTDAGDGEHARQRGTELAGQGLGHRSMLLLAEALRRVRQDRLGRDEKAVSTYVVALLEGYMAGREQGLLEEQNGTLEALVRVRTKANVQ